jgi:hypothetical protein
VRNLRRGGTRASGCCEGGFRASPEARPRCASLKFIDVLIALHPHHPPTPRGSKIRKKWEVMCVLCGCVDSVEKEIYPECLNQTSFLSRSTFWRAASPSPVDLTKPEMVMRLVLPRLMVPSSLSWVRGVLRLRLRAGWRSGPWR